jgi:hypothetical protein
MRASALGDHEPLTVVADSPSPIRSSLVVGVLWTGGAMAGPHDREAVDGRLPERDEVGADGNRRPDTTDETEDVVDYAQEVDLSEEEGPPGGGSCS